MSTAPTDVVVVCTDSTYFLPCAFLLEQLARQPGAARFDIALIHHGPSPEQIDRLKRRIDRPILVIPFPADGVTLPGKPAIEHVSRATYLKLHMHALLPARYARILYLDSDIFIERPGVTELLDLDLGDAAFAAGLDGVSVEYICPEQMTDGADLAVARREAIAHRTALGLAPGQPYLNAGVMLIDRQRWIDRDIPGRALAFALEHPDRCRFAEESAINAVGAGQWAPLSPRWNFLHSHMMAGLEAPIRPVLRHFAGPHKPWSTEALGRRYSRAYREWHAATGWPEAFPSPPSAPFLARPAPRLTWAQRARSLFGSGRRRGRPATSPASGIADAVGAERHAAYRHAALGVLTFNRFVDLPEAQHGALLDALVATAMMGARGAGSPVGVTS